MKHEKAILKITMLPDREDEVLCILNATGDELDNLMMGAMKVFYRATRQAGFTDEKHVKYMKKIVRISMDEIKKEDAE